MRPLKNSTAICHKRVNSDLFSILFIIMSNKMCDSMDLMFEHKEAGMYKDALFSFLLKKLFNLTFHFLFSILKQSLILNMLCLTLNKICILKQNID